jgi:beta-xylosidase
MLLLALIAFAYADSEVIVLDDYNFDTLTQVSNEKNHEDWFVLIYDDNEKSGQQLKQWEMLAQIVFENDYKIHIGKVHDSSGSYDVIKRLKVKAIPQIYYLSKNRAVLTTIDRAD